MTKKLFYLLLLSFFAAQPAHALDQEHREHAKSALMYAGRAQWNDAGMHAKRAGSNGFKTYIQWRYLLDPDSGADFDEIKKFIASHPEWPNQKRLRQRAEAALASDPPNPDAVLDWFSDSQPISGLGKWALAEALAATNGDPDTVNSLLREAWRDGDYDEAEEQAFLARHSDVLRAEDHSARANRLLWEDKHGSAKRMFSRVPASDAETLKARLALAEGAKNAPALVEGLSRSQRADPGLMFDRMVFHANRGDDHGMQELLLDAPDKVPYPELWWKYRERAVREAIDEGNIRIASKLLENHGQLDPAGLSDALWLSGWLSLSFQDKPSDAFTKFTRMFEEVRFPVSKARAAYWAGRAAEAMGNSADANTWYDRAASFSTTFYGQIALQKRGGNIVIPSAPSISSGERAQFERSSLGEAIETLIALGEQDSASKLMNSAIEESKNEVQAALIAELGLKAKTPYLSVRAAKKAMQQNVVLKDAAYPRVKTPSGMDIERALALAIIRQESEFDPRAKSSANAQGLMQLLPATAKEQARKKKMGYAAGKLFEPEYNITLGSHYLGRLVSGYDGSYVMAIAAYNAGPGNVRKWIGTFGFPGSTVESAVNWIEKIPFQETRNYVMRVMENLQLYRQIEQSAPLKIHEDLVR